MALDEIPVNSSFQPSLDFEKKLTEVLATNFEKLTNEQKLVHNTAIKSGRSFNSRLLPPAEQADLEAAKEAFWKGLDQSQKQYILNLSKLPDKDLSDWQYKFVKFAMPSNIGSKPSPTFSPKRQSLFTRFFRWLVVVGTAAAIWMYSSGASKFNSLLVGLFTFVGAGYLLTRFDKSKDAASNKKTAATKPELVSQLNDPEAQFLSELNNAEAELDDIKKLLNFSSGASASNPNTSPAASSPNSDNRFSSDSRSRSRSPSP